MAYNKELDCSVCDGCGFVDEDEKETSQIGGRVLCSACAEKEPHETDCINVYGFKECAEQGIVFAEMCAGCSLYWKRAAALVGKTPQAWIDENTGAA